MRLVTSLLALVILSCATYPRPSNPDGSDVVLGLPEQQKRRSVHISVDCMGKQWTGSGAIVTANKIVTAKHVVACLMDPIILVTLDSGKQLEAKVAVQAEEQDVAVIHTEQAMDSIPIPLIGPAPRIDSRICFYPKSPDPFRVCGFVQGSKYGLLQHSGVTQFGNSGSGVYDEEGRLIGVVSTLRRCVTLPSQVCGGGVALLGPLRNKLGL